MHYDPYDVSRVWVRNHRDGGWIQAPWAHLPMVQAPFADFTWRHARQILTERSCDNTDETAIARVLADVLHRAGTKASAGVAARTRTALQSAGRPELEPPAAARPPEPERDEDEALDDEAVQPFGVFDPTSEEQQPW